MTGPGGWLGRLGAAPRKVALLRASRIGDFICATPAFRALRATLPDAELTLIGLPLVADLAARLPTLDRFIPFPGYPGIAEQFFQAPKALAFFQAAQNEHFDLVIQMHGSGVYANPVALMLGARYTVGFVRPEDEAGRMDAALPLASDGHEVERLLALVEFLGAPRQGTHGDFGLRPEDHQAARMLLGHYRSPLIGIHAGAQDAGKRWRASGFAQAALELQRRQGGTIVLLGGPEEANLGAHIAARVGKCINLAGRTSLPLLGAVTARLSVLVTNDSGPAHIAYALGTPTVTIFNGTDPVRWGPPPGPHRVSICPVTHYPHQQQSRLTGPRCAGEIDVADVAAQAEAVMAPG